MHISLIIGGAVKFVIVVIVFLGIFSASVASREYLYISEL